MFKGKNILITGGNGMIGRALAELIKKESPRYLTIADLPDRIVTLAPDPCVIDRV